MKATAARMKRKAVLPILGEAEKIAAPHSHPDFVIAAANVLKVIEAFSGHTEGVTELDIANQTGLPRASVKHLLTTLQLLGYAELESEHYRLTTRVLRLGFSYLSSTHLTVLAQPVLDDLTGAVQESCSIGILEGDEIVYVARSAAKRVMSVSQPLGSRLPAYCASMGRVLLASLPDRELKAYLNRVELQPLTEKTVTDKKKLAGILQRVRSQGYALCDEELERGLRSLAVPITTPGGRTVAAMNIGVHAARVSTEELMNRVLPILRQHAKALMQVLT